MLSAHRFASVSVSISRTVTRTVFPAVLTFPSSRYRAPSRAPAAPARGPRVADPARPPAGGATSQPPQIPDPRQARRDVVRQAVREGGGRITASRRERQDGDPQTLGLRLPCDRRRAVIG